jgi:hypothetical protein
MLRFYKVKTLNVSNATTKNPVRIRTVSIVFRFHTAQVSNPPNTTTRSSFNLRHGKTQSYHAYNTKMNLHIPFRFHLTPNCSLPISHQIFCQILYQVALHNRQRACIVGSFALKQLMTQMNRTSFNHNDVDVFTTLYFTEEDMNILERKFEQNCTEHFFLSTKSWSHGTGLTK